MGEESETIRKRWVGLHQLAESAEPEDIETLVRITFRTKLTPTHQQMSRILQPFQSTDELFGKGNEREVEVLCGATLSHIATLGGAQASTAALAVATTFFSGLRKADLPVDLVGHCENVLDKMAETQRQRPELSAVGTVSKISFEASSKGVQQQFDATGVAAAFNLAANALQGSIDKINEGFRKHQQALDIIEIQDEELQMLWWLIGERSATLDRSFSSVAANAQPLIFGFELAEMTVVVPGPRSIKGILQRAGVRGNERIEIVAAVNACEIEWLRRILDDSEPSPSSSPVHFAAKRRLETGDLTSWVAGWAATTGLRAEASLPGIALANQFYRERLLIDSARQS
jgi:hypothetical protein